MSMPAIDLNISPERWLELPLPAEANVSVPDFALASAISSLTFAAPPRRVHDQYVRGRVREADRCEVLDRVVTQFRVEARVDHERAHRCKEQRIAVVRGACR